MAHTYNLSTQDAETGRLGVEASLGYMVSSRPRPRPGLQSEILSQKNKKTQANNSNNPSLPKDPNYRLGFAEMLGG
jgi:hypothetical protein